MGKPDDIPDDVWDEANLAFFYASAEYRGLADQATPVEFIARTILDAQERAILAERERCAKVAEHLLRFADTTSAADKVISDAIRSGT